jgi:hypothetical protein
VRKSKKDVAEEKVTIEDVQKLLAEFTPEQHISESERLLVEASAAGWMPHANYYTGMAQVHATLALVKKMN